MALHRRLPFYTRPFPFAAGWLLLVLGLWNGLSWIWTTSVFSGSLLYQILIPTQLIVFDAGHAGWLVAALVGLGLILLSFGSRRGAARGGLWAVRWRFFPLLLFFGIFLMFYGAIWLFDMGIAADVTPGGYAIFITLDYSGLTSRFVLGTIGFLTLGAGLLLVLSSVSIGLGPEARPRWSSGSPASGPAPPTAAPGTATSTD